MERRGYLGIDESNHGAYPEIFVAVYSDNFKDIFDSGNKLSKKRGDHNDVFSVLEGKIFKHLLISEREGRILGERGIHLVVLSEFIRYFSPLKAVIVDGRSDRRVVGNIKNLLDPLPCPEVKYFPFADTKYELVNTADHVANLLFKYYTKSSMKDMGKKYDSHLIRPSMNSYFDRLESMCIL